MCSACDKRRYKNKVNLTKKPWKDYKRYKNNICKRCGFIPEDKCQLDVHHLDGNHNNNDPNNLQTLCANCHRLMHKKRSPFED